MTSLINKLSLALVAGLVAAVGFVTPAQAANLTVSATSSGGSIGTSGTNAFEIGVTYTTVTAGTDSLQVQIPTGWTAVNLANLCSVMIVNDQSMSSWSCNASVISGEVVVTITNTSGTWPSSSGISVRFPANTLNVTASRTFNVQTFTGQGLTDMGSGTLASSVLMPTAFTVTNASLVDANSNAITNLPASSAVPAFTATASGFSAGGEYSRVGIIFSKSGNTEYFPVPNPQNIMNSAPTTSAWSPGNAACGITAISIGGVAQTGSSGIVCSAETWTNNGVAGYAIRFTLAANTSASLSVSVASNVFTSTTAGNYNFRLALSSVPAQNSNTYYSGSKSVPFTVGGSSSPSPSVSSAAANISLSATPGQTVAGSSVAVSASGLQSSAPYTVVVQSTPQTIGSGTAVNGAVSTNVTIPSGLEPGWHTLTFSSTAADGSPIVSVTYFKVSASGTLLATANTVPTELANTGINTAAGIFLLVGGASLALVGAELLLIARRKRSN